MRARAAGDVHLAQRSDLLLLGLGVGADDTEGRADAQSAVDDVAANDNG